MPVVWQMGSSCWAATQRFCCKSSSVCLASGQGSAACADPAPSSHRRAVWYWLQCRAPPRRPRMTSALSSRMVFIRAPLHFSGCLGYRRRHRLRYTGIKSLGQDVFLVSVPCRGPVRQWPGRPPSSWPVDVPGTHRQGALEDTREGQHVVDLIGETDRPVPMTGYRPPWRRRA